MTRRQAIADRKRQIKIRLREIKATEKKIIILEKKAGKKMPPNKETLEIVSKIFQEALWINNLYLQISIIQSQPIQPKRFKKGGLSHINKRNDETTK